MEFGLYRELKQVQRTLMALLCDIHIICSNRRWSYRAGCYDCSCHCNLLPDIGTYYNAPSRPAARRHAIRRLISVILDRCEHHLVQLSLTETSNHSGHSAYPSSDDAFIMAAARARILNRLSYHLLSGIDHLPPPRTFAFDTST